MRKGLLVTAMLAGLTISGLGAAQTGGKPQIGTFGLDTAGMNRSLDPGDDFDAYTSSAWRDKFTIPADKGIYDMFDQLGDLSRERLRTILDDAAKQPGSQIGDFYTSFMDEATIDAKGAAPVKPWLDAIMAAPDKAALAAEMGKLNRINGGSLWRAGVGQDDKAPDQYIMFLDQSGLGLNERDFYVNPDAKSVALRKVYLSYLTKILTLSGAATEADAGPRAQAVLDFETKLASAHWTRTERRDADKAYNKWAFADLAKKAPGFPWDAWAGGAGIDRARDVVVAEPSAFTGEAAAFGAAPLPVLKDHLAMLMVGNYARYLSKPFADADFAIDQAFSGSTEQEARWKRGVTLVDGKIGEALGKVYVARYFPPASKVAADKLVKNIIAAMGERLKKLEWMAPETKAKALEKLAAFKPKIGYPDKWRDYSSVVIKRDDLVGNVARANEFEFQRGLNKLGKPVDRSEWAMTPSTVNAYANPTMNEIVFPAAILQPPFFDPNADPAINYGGIGGVIGHEISHHFDDQGRKYDKTGKLADWWTPEDVKRFTTFTDALIAQYNAYEPLPGAHVKGDQTLGENIADLAGLTVAFDAYHASLGGKPVPVIGGFTGDQRFYLGWAQVWRAKTREDMTRTLLALDFHSPDRYRADIVRNSDGWYAAFKPRPGSKLYLTPDKRVRIW